MLSSVELPSMRQETAQQAFMFRDYLGAMGFNDDILRLHLGKADQAIDSFDEELDPQVARGDLLAIRDGLAKEFWSSRFLTAQYIISNVLYPMEDTAFSFMSSNSLAPFIVWFDLSYGAGMVTGTVATAELELKGGTQQIQREAVESSHGMMPFEVNIDDVQAEVSARIERSARLLEEDETGLTLVEEVIKSIKQEPNRLDQNTTLTEQIPQLVIRGAEFAGHVYKSIYPIAEEVLMG